MPQLIYHTIDPVNLDTLRDFAEAFGLEVEDRQPREHLAGPAAILVDADFWWTTPGERRQGIEELIRLDATLPVAVHGWQLSDEEIGLLRDNGILASDRLDAELIRRIADEIAAMPAVAGEAAAIPTR
jgi:hypothetical protein